MLELLSEGQIAALVGAAGGIVLGLAARLGRFCTLGAIEDLLYGDSDLRLRQWALAIGVAMVGSFALMAGGWLDPLDTVYLSGGFNPLAHILGGLVFGGGMALAGNCGYGALARLGGGDLRSFVIVLVMGIAAYVTLSGPLAPLRVALFPRELVETAGPSGLAHGLSALTGLPAAAIGIVAGVAVALFSLASPAMRREPRLVFWGAAVGLVVAYAWAATSWRAHESFGAVGVEGYTFVAPLGEAILFAMTSTGSELDFAVGAVAGVWTGAFVGSLIRGHFRWEACEDPRELRRQIFGAAMMGVGGALAVGCTVGQGLSAISLLAYGAPLTMAGIFVGAALGLRFLISGFASA